MMEAEVLKLPRVDLGLNEAVKAELGVHLPETCRQSRKVTVLQFMP